MSDDAVKLTIGGLMFGGWTEVEIASGIDSVAASFRLGITERWPGHPDRWVIDAGAPAVVSIGGEPLITGYVDRIASDLAKGQHSISAEGRSKTGDLVDCSAVASPGSWSNRSLEAIAGELAAPFGITVTAEADTAPVFAKFALQQGETVWEAIERMLRQRGLLGYTDTAGNVRIFTPKPGSASVTLTEGVDVKTVSGHHDVSDRFSVYIAKGQAAGNDQASGATVAGPKAQASDTAVTRYRPLIVMAEDQASPASLTKRANWEAITRAARAQQVTVEYAGWRRPDGALWQPAQLVRLIAPSSWIDATLMIVSVTFHLFKQRGRVVELKLARPEAYTQLPVPEGAEASSIIKQRPTAKLSRRG